MESLGEQLAIKVRIIVAKHGNRRTRHLSKEDQRVLLEAAKLLENSIHVGKAL